MFKKLTTILTTLTLGLFLTVNTAFASLSVRVEQPKSPSNQTSINLIFVTLDTENQAITAKCYKKAPSDGGFSQFGSDIVLANGGNTSNCVIDSSMISTEGAYQFYVTVNNGSQTLSSNTVNVDISRSGPGKPTNYSKDKPTSCEYKIHFRTADDAGKTVKVEIYRSENKSFSTDSGNRVGSVSIGSNTDHDFVQSVPDCNKTYYYAVRAFNSAGTGSEVVGDKDTVVTTSTTITGTAGAIPVSSDQTGSVLGAEDATTTPTDGEKDKDKSDRTSDENNQSEDSNKDVQGASTSSWFTFERIMGVALIAVVLALIYWYFKNKSKK